MGISERREREKTAVRDRILDAARDLFANQGYEAVTMRQIAQRIEYTPTAIYFHFKDKQSLLTELCSREFLKFAGVFQHLGTIREPLLRLQLMARAYVEFGLQNPNQYRWMFMTPHPPLREEDIIIRKGNPAEDAYAFLRTTVGECFISGHMRPEYKDPELVSQMLWSSIHGVVALHIAMAHDDWFQWRKPQITSAELVETVLRGFTTKEDGAMPKLRASGEKKSYGTKLRRKVSTVRTSVKKKNGARRG